MQISRRDLNFLLPVLAAAGARAQQPTQTPVATIVSKVYSNEAIPFTGEDKDKKESREFFLLATHSGFKVQMHETGLGPGVESHAPHQHVHEEIIILTEGTLEANLDGVKHSMTTGSAVVFGSNQLHNVRNPGTVPAKYYVIELRGTES